MNDFDQKLLDHYRAEFKRGEYSFHAPPVCTALWGSDDWIRFIYACRGFHSQRPKS